MGAAVAITRLDLTASELRKAIPYQVARPLSNNLPACRLDGIGPYDRSFRWLFHTG